MRRPDLSVIIPVYNKFSLTRDCLRSLHEYAPDVSMEVIVVDNGSSDETSTELAPLGMSLFGDAFSALHLPQNRNFGPACNLGADKSSGESVFFLNNDTILTEGWFDPLAAGLSDSVGMVGPLLLYPGKEGEPDRVQHLGVACKPQLHPVHLYEFFPVDHPVVRKRRTLQFLTGAAMLMPKAVFDAAGHFHEAYINGGEDLDLCVQVRRQGYSLQCIPESRIYHLQSQTPGRHDHEKHNGQVFKERCMSDIYPDMHVFLQSDGYELALDEQLVPYARLPERRAALLGRAFGRGNEEPDEAACRDMMSREPLFAPAYERLAGILETQRDVEKLAELRFLQARLFPGIDATCRLGEVAERAGNETYGRYARTTLDFYRELQNNPDLEPMAREMVSFGRHLQQPVITDLYTRWLVERTTKTAE